MFFPVFSKPGIGCAVSVFDPKRPTPRNGEAAMTDNTKQRYFSPEAGAARGGKEIDGDNKMKSIPRDRDERTLPLKVKNTGFLLDRLG